MPDEIKKPVEQQSAPVTAPSDAPVTAAKPKPKAKAKPKKKAPAKKKPVIAAMTQAPADTVKKPEPKKSESPLVFSAPKAERKPERTSKVPRSGFAKWIVLAVLVIAVLGVSALAFNAAQQANTKTDQAASDIRSQVNGEVSGLKDSLQKLAQELQAQKESKDVIALSDYQNPDIGLSFRYPASLGTVQAQTEDTKGKKLITLTFSSNPDLWIIASSGDSKTTTNAFAYDGSEKDLAATCKEPLKVTKDGYCDLIAVLGSQTVERVHPVGEDTLLNVVKTVPLNWNNPVYKGLSFNVGLGLPPVTGRDLFAAPDSKELDASLEQFFRNLIKKDQLSLVVQDNLTAFQSILTSLQTPVSGS